MSPLFLVNQSFAKRQGAKPGSRPMAETDAIRLGSRAPAPTGREGNARQNPKQLPLKLAKII